MWICLRTFARIIPCQSVNHTVRYNPERQMCLVITAHKGFSKLASSVNLHLGCVSVTALYEPFSLQWWEEGNSHLKPCGGVTCQALTCGAAGASCLHDKYSVAASHPINQCNSISLEPWLTLTLLCLSCDFPQRLVSARNIHVSFHSFLIAPQWQQLTSNQNLTLQNAIFGLLFAIACSNFVDVTRTCIL